ncbi:pseudaminic acid biosynthesis-associated methylase [Glaciecola sp. 1036]|uniref:pseudaminic acid biosynthesis-associated methylase n=1 Tax=Alteromonadaceae TaxID=72275 RepID=UPI003D00CB01
MQSFKTEQEAFWAGEFGEGYRQRNQSSQLYHAKVAAWAQMLKAANNINSALELGCNIGLNLRALNGLNPDLKLHGVEINEESAQVARDANVAEITTGSIIEPLALESFDLTFTCGVLIHIHPDFLHRVYANLVNLSNKYVLVAEYYNPSPMAIPYRGHEDRLFKRDFAGELIEQHNLKLVDYGFFYKRDHLIPMDDISWFLLEK